MRLVKLGVACLNPTVGAVRDNAELVLEAAHALADDRVSVACFPEQVLGGYPAEDLVHWNGFLAAQRRELERVARETEGLPLVLVLGLAVGLDGDLYNAAAVVHAGKILGLVPKEKLPTYDIFYEARVYTRGGPGLALDADGIPLGDFLFGFDFGTLAVDICEDVWTPSGPMRRRCFSGAEIAINLSASPYRVGVEATRLEMLATRSADNQTVLVYANRVGGQDGLIFDGGALAFQNGRGVLRGPRFQAGSWTCVVDLDRTRRLRRQNTTWRREDEAFLARGASVPVLRSGAPTADRQGLAYPPPGPDGFFLPAGEPGEAGARDRLLDELFEALSLGVADYFRKAAPFRGMGVALSGGRDSLLTLLVAWRALERLGSGTEAFLQAFYLPSRFSASATREAARTICRELDVPLTEVSIDEAFEREMEAARSMLGGNEPTPVTLQNIQARIRGQRMWNWANSAGALFLQTSDMSEKAVGYVTVGGDLEGGLSPIANLPKTVVVALLGRLAERFDLEGVRLTLETEASPELAAGQRAEDDLMAFPLLDACLHLYGAEKMSPREVARVLPALFPEEEPERLAAAALRFAEMFTASIYKWVQAPLSLHVGTLDLERERALQLPVVQRTQWDEPIDGGEG
jgi:NAD+ synthase (glutamine-hydrolysing)